jgi:hypothetical protein
MSRGEYTEDGYWIPPKPGGTPGWGGVGHFRCMFCETSTDYWIGSGESGGNRRPPRVCRQCLLDGRRPPDSPVTWLAKNYALTSTKAADEIEQEMRQAFARERNA